MNTFIQRPLPGVALIYFTIQITCIILLKFFKQIVQFQNIGLILLWSSEDVYMKLTKYEYYILHFLIMYVSYSLVTLAMKASS